MYKIAICGKANSGKNTLGKLIVDEICQRNENSSALKGWDVQEVSYKFIAFADPLKKMLRIAYPDLPRKYLYGSSKYRAKVIPGAFKNGVPLTIRQALIDLGNDFGRANKPDIWLRNFDYSFNKMVRRKTDIVVVTDVRFRNEFNHLKTLGFFQTRLWRDEYVKIDDESETNQDSIKDDEFDFIIHNNGTIDDLKCSVSRLVDELVHK